VSMCVSISVSELLHLLKRFFETQRDAKTHVILVSNPDTCLSCANGFWRDSCISSHVKNTSVNRLIYVLEYNTGPLLFTINYIYIIY